jgi:hypothetical protein
MAELFSSGYGLLIGIGGDLPVTTADATGLRDLLIDEARAAYPPENVEMVVEAKATRETILCAFDRLQEKVVKDPEATVIVYFSGHGGCIERPGKDPEYFLVPHGYDPSRRPETAISGAEFTEKIQAITAGKMLVLLDCCHAGGVPALKRPDEFFKKAPLPPELLSVLKQGSGQVVLASSLEEEFSYTGPIYSIFTACLLEALQGKAAVEKDGFARILDVLIYLYKNVPKRAAGPQHPFLNRVEDLTDNFALCYYAGGGKSPPGEARNDQLAPVQPSFLSSGERQRLERQRNSLRQEWDLLERKTSMLRRELSLETQVESRFRMEQHLLEDEASRATIEAKLEIIEARLK